VAKIELCGITSNSGPNGEPLACGYVAGHEGAHAWSTLPTFALPIGLSGGGSSDRPFSQQRVEPAREEQLRNALVELIRSCDEQWRVSPGALETARMLVYPDAERRYCDIRESEED
jgi:hypothetical protein